MAFDFNACDAALSDLSARARAAVGEELAFLAFRGVVDLGAFVLDLKAADPWWKQREQTAAGGPDGAGRSAVFDLAGVKCEVELDVFARCDSEDEPGGGPRGWRYRMEGRAQARLMVAGFDGQAGGKARMGVPAMWDGRGRMRASLGECAGTSHGALAAALLALRASEGFAGWLQARREAESLALAIAPVEGSARNGEGRARARRL